MCQEQYLLGSYKILTLMIRTLFIWMLYPIAWGLCEGGNVISSDSEAVFYGILDFCAKPIFSLMLLRGHRQIRIVSFDQP